MKKNLKTKIIIALNKANQKKNRKKEGFKILIKLE